LLAFCHLASLSSFRESRRWSGKTNARDYGSAAVEQVLLLFSDGTSVSSGTSSIIINGSLWRCWRRLSNGFAGNTNLPCSSCRDSWHRFSFHSQPRAPKPRSQRFQSGPATRLLYVALSCHLIKAPRYIFQWFASKYPFSGGVRPAANLALLSPQPQPRRINGGINLAIRAITRYRGMYMRLDALVQIGVSLPCRCPRRGHIANYPAMK
jgi:hypothetical protein